MILTLLDGAVGKLQACEQLPPVGCLRSACRRCYLTLRQCLGLPIACGPGPKRFLLSCL